MQLTTRHIAIENETTYKLSQKGIPLDVVPAAYMQQRSESLEQKLQNKSSYVS